MKTKHLRLMQRVYIILFFCFMYLPIAYMIVFSFNQSKGYALFTGFTFKWYTSLLHNESILHALWVSLYSGTCIIKQNHKKLIPQSYSCPGIRHFQNSFYSKFRHIFNF